MAARHRSILTAVVVCSSVTFASVATGQTTSPGSRVVDVNGTRLTYEERGDGPPVVFIHGGFADHRIWEPQRSAVPAGYRFVALTLRYFGTAPWPDKGESFAQETHVADIAAFLKQLNAGPVVLVGRSYGAYCATLVTLRHPELVRGLVLNEPPIASLLVSADDKAVLASDFAAMAPVQAAIKAGRNEEATRLFADWTNADPGGFDRLPETARQMHLDNARTTPLQLTAARNIPVSCAEMSRLHMPVSIVKGELGRAYFKRIADVMQACIPGAELTTVAGARHGAPSERPDDFNRIVSAFLGRLR
jgi:pimeloyl-ACP methyl ester carboxylesterase